jgi:hypothetical protein
MPILILMLFFFGINWIASYVMVIIPIHLGNYLGSFWGLTLGIIILLIFSWFFGD